MYSRIMRQSSEKQNQMETVWLAMAGSDNVPLLRICGSCAADTCMGLSFDAQGWCVSCTALYSYGVITRR